MIPRDIAGALARRWDHATVEAFRRELEALPSSTHPALVRDEHWVCPFGPGCASCGGDDE